MALRLPFLGTVADEHPSAGACKDLASCNVVVPVALCLQVNANSAVQVQIGRRHAPSGEVVYRDAPAQTSWGNCLRTLRWIRNVPYDAFVRIRVCGQPSTCADTCGSVVNDAGISYANKVIRVIVDNMDVTQALQCLLDSQTYVSPGVTIGCQAPLLPGTSDCCHDGTTVLFDSLYDMPHGSEIVLGPLNSTFVVQCA